MKTEAGDVSAELFFPAVSAEWFIYWSEGGIELTIEVYSTYLFCYYMGAAVLLTVTGGIYFLSQKDIRGIYGIVCTLAYSFWGIIIHILYSLADDPAEPNYELYLDWSFKSAVMQDIILIVIFMSIFGICCYSVKRRSVLFKIISTILLTICLIFALFFLLLMLMVGFPFIFFVVLSQL